VRDLLLALVNVLWFAILGQVILSWLVMAGMRNEFIFRLDHGLRIITEPLMRPLRRVVPTIGRIDITPIAAILLLSVVRQAVTSL